jgi:hypothetical protein
MPTPVSTEVRRIVQDGATRAVGAVALAGVALIHILDSPDTIASRPTSACSTSP